MCISEAPVHIGARASGCRHAQRCTATGGKPRPRPTTSRGANGTLCPKLKKRAFNAGAVRLQCSTSPATPCRFSQHWRPIASCRQQGAMDRRQVVQAGRHVLEHMPAGGLVDRAAVDMPMHTCMAQHRQLLLIV